MKRHRVGKGRRHPIRIVSSWDAALRLLDGKTVKDSEGIEGVIKVVRVSPHEKRVLHVKTARGKATEAYQKTKRVLGDDWDTDLSVSDNLGPMMEELGVRFTTPQGNVQRAGGSYRSMRGARGRT